MGGGIFLKKWKFYQICLFVLLCILLNYGGSLLATALSLPFWLDSFGTILCAYIGGPVCGSIVGVTGNLIHGMEKDISWIYALTSIGLGVIVGTSAQRKKMEDAFGAMTVGALAAIFSVAISLPLNVLYYDGYTGNLFGDGVIHYLQELKFPSLLCSALGQFYLDFPDKLLTVMTLFGLVKLFRYLSQKKKSPKEAASLTSPEKHRDPEKALKPLSLLLIFLLAASACSKMSLVKASELTGSQAAGLIEYNDYVQSVYSSNNGLPCGEANDIAQTNDGILWIGTYAGLYRYNGNEFRWMDNYDSVRNVNCLYVDDEGRLWIGTNDNGLSISINERIVNVLDQGKGLPSNSVRSIIESSDGYYYIGTTGSMQIITLNSGMKTISTLWEANYADHITADENGHVAAVTSDGRLFLLKEGQIMSSLQLPSEEDIFRSCAFDRDGTLLAGTSNRHVYRYDISSEAFEEANRYYYPDLSSINDIYFKESGEIFFSSDNGIGYQDRNREYHSIYVNDFNNSIDNMLVDYQGNLWFTSSRLGLLRLSPSPFKDVYNSAGMQHQVVNTIARWQDHYYIGTDNGLDIVDDACRTQISDELTKKLTGVRIRCLYTDSSDHLWICTYGKGLWEAEPKGELYYYNHDNGSFGNRARLAIELSDGTIVVAGDTGISFIRNHEILQTIGYADGLINSMILTLTELDDGRLLAGTDGDGIAVIKNCQVEQMLTREDGLSSEVILRTVKDPGSEGVFLVTSNGLCYMDSDGSIRSLDNFPYFNNYDIWAKDENTLYVLGSAGIYIVDREELLSGSKDLSYNLLDSGKGLSSALTANSWNYFDQDKSLFLSCDTGVYILDTEACDADSRIYRMNISSVLLDNKPHHVESGSPIEISRGISRVELHPEIINYSIQNPLVGYYLEGFEKNWNILPQSSLGSIVYTNLDNGKYTFHLAVFDSNREEILEERSYPIIKEKEIYDNVWFRFYMLFIAMLAVAWFTWFLVRRQVERTLEYQRRTLEYQKKTMELQTRELEVVHQQIQMGNETIMAIAKAVDAKDERTSQHSQRVSEYAVLIGRELGFSEEECENLRKAARMHDIGKIGIPDSILNKPARLTDEEYAIMKSHAARGGEILKDFTLIEHVSEGAWYHHERYDGRGYPQGLSGENIPLYARIIGVADAFDAMTANRVYRKQMDFDYVLNEMRKGRGTQFDPQMVDIFLKLIDNGTINLNTLYPAAPETKADEKEGL